MTAPARLIALLPLLVGAACAPRWPFRASAPPPPPPAVVDTTPPPPDLSLPAEVALPADSATLATLWTLARAYDRAQTFGTDTRLRGAPHFAQLARAIATVPRAAGSATHSDHAALEGTPVASRAAEASTAPRAWTLPGAWARPRFPSAPVRAASAIELWRLLRREYAYRTLGDEDIDAALLRVLPAVIAARDSIAYATALRDLLAATSDSRATLDDPTLDARLGAGELPVDVRAIDGEMVVTRVHAAARASGIEPGDVIERLDDDPIERKFDAFDRLVSASNSWRRRFDLVQLFARGPIGSSVAVQVRRPTTRNRTEQRTLSLVRVARDAREEPPRGAALSVPAPGVALLDATQLDSARVDSLRALSASARPRALLVDLRQGVSPTAASLLAWLADRPDVPVALERRTIAPTLDERERLTHERTMVLRADTTSRYAGRVVVFIDERVDDAAERVALALVTLGAVPIGGPTAGAVGPRARQELPGGFAVTYAHRDVRWPDGRQLQRIGIQSLVDARPTVAGMRAGIDESVAAALRWIDPPRAPGRSR